MSDTTTMWALGIVSTIVIAIAAVTTRLIYLNINNRFNELNQQISELAHQNQERAKLQQIINTPAPAATGDNHHPDPPRPWRPVVIKGGGTVAMLAAVGGVTRRLWQHHPQVMLAALAATTATTATVYTTVWSGPADWNNPASPRPITSSWLTPPRPEPSAPAPSPTRREDSVSSTPAAPSSLPAAPGDSPGEPPGRRTPTPGGPDRDTGRAGQRNGQEAGRPGQDGFEAPVGDRLKSGDGRGTGNSDTHGRGPGKGNDGGRGGDTPRPGPSTSPRGQGVCATVGVISIEANACVHVDDLGL